MANINIKESLGTKVGPLPMAAWGALAIVAIIIISAYRKKTATSASVPNGTADTTTVGYVDANGNPIVAAWTNLPTTATEIDTSTEGNGGTVTPTPPVTNTTNTPAPSPIKTPTSGLAHTNTAPKKARKIVPVVHTTHKQPVSHKVIPTHAQTVHTPPPTIKRPVAVKAKSEPVVNRRSARQPAKTPAQMTNESGRPAGEHSGSRIGDLNGAPRRRVVSGATMARRRKVVKMKGSH